MAISFLQEAEDHHLYGILSRRTPLKANMELLSRELNVESSDNNNNALFVDLCVPDISRIEFENIFDYHPYWLCVRRLLCCVGDGYFCYMTYGQGTTITLFKEISHHHDDDHTESSGQGEKLSFQAKILHHQEYEMRFPSYNMAKFIECFVVSHEPKAKKASSTSS